MSRIPRHFHFIFGLRVQNEPFHIIHYLCLESCLRINRPDRVTLYYHYKPDGRYWNLIKHRIELVRVPLNPEVTGKHYASTYIGRHLRYAHHADFIRMEKLIECGGVYADIDTLFVRPIPDELYTKSFVIGREDPVTNAKTGVSEPSLCNALMMAEPGSEFARIWLERMPAALDGSWSNHSCQLAERLRGEFPHLVHVEPPVSFYPFMWTPSGLKALLEENQAMPAEAFSIHLWAHMWWARGNALALPDNTRLTAGKIRMDETTYTLAARRFMPPVTGPLRRFMDRAREDVRYYVHRAWRKLCRLPAR
jgi:hypothetical protein